MIRSSVCWAETDVCRPRLLCLLRIDVRLKLGMRSQHPQVGDLAGRHHGQQHIRRRRDQRKRAAAQERQQVPVVQKCHFEVFAESHGLMAGSREHESMEHEGEDAYSTAPCSVLLAPSSPCSNCAIKSRM